MALRRLAPLRSGSMRSRRAARDESSVAPSARSVERQHRGDSRDTQNGPFERDRKNGAARIGCAVGTLYRWSKDTADGSHTRVDGVREDGQAEGAAAGNADTG